MISYGPARNCDDCISIPSICPDGTKSLGGAGTSAAVPMFLGSSALGSTLYSHCQSSGGPGTERRSPRKRCGKPETSGTRWGPAVSRMDHSVDRVREFMGHRLASVREIR